MALAIITLFLVPWLDTSKVRSGRYRPLFKQFFFIFILACLGLGYAGAKPPEGLPLAIAQVSTVYYLAFFWIIMPLLGVLETPKDVPDSISQPVLKGSGTAQTATAAE